MITGASSGIGRALAKKIAKLDYYVVLISRSEDKLISVSEEIYASGGKCQYLVADIANSECMKNIGEKIKTLPPLSILINNAGVGFFGRIEDLNVKEVISQIDINLKAPILFCQKFIPLIKKNNHGIIVFINSIAGRQIFSNSATYIASKFGLRGFADSLREDLRKDNIKVISVFPGAIDTPFWDKIQGKFPRDSMLNVASVSDAILHNVLNVSGDMIVEDMVFRKIEGNL